MAKRGFGSALLAFLGSVAAAAVKENKNRRQAAESEYKRAFKQELPNFADEQAEFDAYVMSLPVLKGDRSFLIPADLYYADDFALQAFHMHLEIMHEEGQSVWVIVRDAGEKEFPGRRLKLEVSQAEMGYIEPEDEMDIAPVVEAAGGVVRCGGRFVNVGGAIELWLDISIPAEIRE